MRNTYTKLIYKNTQSEGEAHYRGVFGEKG